MLVTCRNEEINQNSSGYEIPESLHQPRPRDPKDISAATDPHYYSYPRVTPLTRSLEN